MDYYRRLPEFEYLAPKGVEEALSLLERHQGDVRIVAGGTIVIHRMKERIGVRRFLMGLKKLPDLDYIRFDPSSGLRIGAMAGLQSVADSPVVREKYGLLSTTCAMLGTPQIRNMGTIGGNVSCKLPAAETVPALIALGAEARVISKDGERMIPLELLNMELKQTELLLEIRVPALSANKSWGYEKFGVRQKYDYATASAAVVMSADKGTTKEIRIAIGGVPSKRMEAAEAVIQSRKITEALIEEAAQAASESAKTTGDLFFSAAYKKELIGVLVKRAFSKAWVNG